ncbi:alpha-amylase family glycosyl hydrolase [Winogradskyella sp.]|uniref:alpha-amylase family glycosyl hydrolase n=1 Tax=Winogradskyella sp. TaxID=1883156 RepID=UPI002618093B|nr:alpha-amylase family glycosyl hydrolase [Winogradskyella sp.]
MKKITFLIAVFAASITVAQQQTVQFEVNPCSFQDSDDITITFFGDSIDESAWSITNNELFLWSWSFDENDTNEMDSPFNGSWTNSNPASQLTYNPGSDTYTITLNPNAYYQRSNIGRIGFLIKAQNGTGDKKSQDILVEVGESAFSVFLDAPSENSLLISSGDNVTITASNTCGLADYVLKANGVTIDTQLNTASYTYTANNVLETTSFSLEVTQGPDTKVISVTALLNPNISPQTMPSNLVDGINYDDNDPTKATLVLDAPSKDYIYVAGSFNDYAPDNTYAMIKDDGAGSTKFFLELTNLTPGEINTYQYWVVDENPPANSPTLVKAADPYSTLILSSFDDPFIPASTYPNLPEFPDRAEFEVTVLQTGQTSYNWQVPNFNKPKKEDLIIYEVLIRDFDADRNYQDLIDKIDYFKNLNINAIHLMPVMEFEGNESWGYNTSYHMALDKFYGTENKFKEFIDLCHQNGIAIILDLVLNHAFGRSPMVRMWMSDSDGNGFGDPTSDNPYFHTVPQHDYNVGYDYNHQNDRVKDYVKRVIKHWIEEYKIDGFRWDLTKGFTNNCGPGSPGGCTDSYQQDRVDVLKEYTDYAWSLDPTHYTIFEHLGPDNEEQQWANHRVNEGLGVMMWGKMTNEYTDLAQGFSSNINRMGHVSRGFNEPRLLGYPESHDEERIMYEAVTFGNNSNSSHNVRDLNTALSRMSALGAVSVLIPGPKMIWHFGDLGMDNSIWTCGDGTTVSPGNDGCKLATKPQPQWVENWLSDALRSQIYEDWGKFHKLKVEEPVFEGDYDITSDNLIQRVDIFDSSIPTTQLRNVIIYANFDVTSRNIFTNFPSGVTSTWYDLMDPTGNTTVPNGTGILSIPAGQFRIFGNQPSNVLSIDDQEFSGFTIYPNPSTTSFSVNTNVSNVEIYDLTGKMVKAYRGDFTRTDAFDISSLNTGMYIVKVENDNNQTMTTKLVKL